MIILDNAFLILGINVDATDNFINKRYKEQLKLLSVDEIPAYPTDISFVDYKKIRTENKVKEAFHNLTDQNNKLLQIFFWFDISDWKDWELFSMYQNWKEWYAVNSWLSEFNKMKDFHYLKNYLVWTLIGIEQFKDEESTISDIKKQWVDGFKMLFETDSFRSSFVNKVNSQNNIKISKEKIPELKKKILQHLSDSFHNDWETEMYKWIAGFFWVAAKDIDWDKIVIKEINTIKKFLWKIKTYNLKIDIDELKLTIKAIQASIKNLHDLWMDKNSDYLKVKDDVATELLDIAIDLNNTYDNVDDAVEIIWIAKDLASWALLKERIKKNQKTAEGNAKQLEVNKFIERIHKSLDKIKDPKSLDEYDDILYEVWNIRYLMISIEDLELLEEKTLDKIKDDIWYTLLACWIKFNNDFWDPDKSRTLLTAAKEFATSKELKERLPKEINTAEWNIRNKRASERPQKSSWCLSVIILFVIIIWTIIGISV